MQSRFLVRAAIAVGATTMIALLVLSVYRPVNAAAVLAPGKADLNLGSGNQPLDMIPYTKDGHEYILIANTSYGVVKLRADTLATDKPIDSPTVTDVAGAPYDRITTLTNVRHLARVDDGHALVVSAVPGAVSLQTIALP